MNKIIVDPSRLDDTANRVDAANEEYEKLYRALYSEVDKMSISWQGKDNNAFVNRIKSFEEDFLQISIILKQYTSFLRASARAYREMQEELVNSANRLKGGY